MFQGADQSLGKLEDCEDAIHDKENVNASPS